MDIELLLRRALRAKQEPSQQLNESVLRLCEKRTAQGADENLEKQKNGEEVHF